MSKWERKYGELFLYLFIGLKRHFDKCPEDAPLVLGELAEYLEPMIDDFNKSLLNRVHKDD